MPTLIIHHQGAYNLYTTVADGPCYESALTHEQLRNVIHAEGGDGALDALADRLERAHETGCSATIGTTLAECIQGNRVGPDRTELPLEEFIARYLTLPATSEGPLDSEKIYDDQIAPLLKQAADLCLKYGMSMAAVCEYQMGDTGITCTAPLDVENTGATMFLADRAVRARGNLDALLMSVIRHAKQFGHGSLYLSHLGVPVKPEDAANAQGHG